MVTLFGRAVRAAMVSGLMVVGGLAAAGPVTVAYQLNNLGGGQYEYTYKITNNALPGLLSSLLLDFDTALYDESSLTIQTPTYGTPTWGATLFPSLPGVPASVDLYPLLAGTGLAAGESVQGLTIGFSWLGTGLPGAQAFSVFDPDNGFSLLATDVTVAADTPPGVPEPGALALAVLALTAAGWSRRRTVTDNTQNKQSAVSA